MNLCRSLKTATVLVIASAAFVTSASAALINFDTLTGTGSPAVFSTYTESGFTVTNSAGQFYIATVFGDPVPSLFSGSVVGYADSAVTVTRVGGGGFYLNYFDLASNLGSTDYAITGSMGGAQTFTFSGTQGDTAKTFVQINNPFPTDFVSSAVFSFDGLGSSYNLDNIDVSTTLSDIPEPSSLLLFGTGAVLMAGAVRRRLFSVS